MSVAESVAAPSSPVLDRLLPLCAEAEAIAESFDIAAKNAVRKLIAPSGRVDAKLLEREQFAAHGYAWIATYVAGLRQMRRWAEALKAHGTFGELEQLTLQSAFGEYLNQLAGGIAISQVEVVRPGDLGIDDMALRALDAGAARILRASGNTAAVRARIATLLADALDTGDFGALGLDDEALTMVREQFRRFVNDEVMPFAHDWHMKDELIPLPVVEKRRDTRPHGRHRHHRDKKDLSGRSVQPPAFARRHRDRA